MNDSRFSQHNVCIHTEAYMPFHSAETSMRRKKNEEEKKM